MSNFLNKQKQILKCTHRTVTRNAQPGHVSWWYRSDPNLSISIYSVAVCLCFASVCSPILLLALLMGFVATTLAARPKISASVGGDLRVESASDFVLVNGNTSISLSALADDVAVLKADTAQTCGPTVIETTPSLSIAPAIAVAGVHATRIGSANITANGVHLVVLDAVFQAIWNPDVAPLAVTVQAHITTVDNPNTGRLATFSTKVFTTVAADSGRFVLTPVAMTRTLTLTASTTLFFFVEYCYAHGYTGTPLMHQTEPSCDVDPAEHGAALTSGYMSVTPLATLSCD